MRPMAPTTELSMQAACPGYQGANVRLSLAHPAGRAALFRLRAILMSVLLPPLASLSDSCSHSASTCSNEERR
jgi:hypothetical protein